MGSTSKILRSPQQVKKLQADFAKQTAQAQAMAQTAAGAQAAGALGKASVGPGTALGALVGAPGG